MNPKRKRLVVEQEKPKPVRRRLEGTEEPKRRTKRKVPKADPEVMTIDEVSKMLRVSPRAIYHLIRDKKIPALKVGTKFRFYRKAIIDALSRID